MATKAPKGTVVEEDRRLFLRKEMEDFRDSNIESLRFPANLSNIERKFIHKVAAELNLVSKSSGGGADRFITVWKRDSTTAPAKAQGLSKQLLSWELSASMRSTLQSANLFCALDAINHDLGSDSTSDNNKSSHRTGRNNLSDHLPRIHESFSIAEARRMRNPQYAELERKRAMLPAAQHRADVIAIIKKEQIVLISGETGCGKSTQIPQFLLEDPSIGPVSRIVITQPRRISAISLAERIAFERSESVGDIIGYNIRMENKLSPQTQVLFVTPGVLLRKLLDDPDLQEFSHVIVDEAHERDRFTEFLLIVLRDIAQRRSSLKLILMSATMHTNKLCAYFGDIPQINVGGSVFPVQEFFLEHALKFIHYSPRSLAAMTTSNLAAPLALTESASFFCSVCQKGPFISAEELGTHCALCFPSDTEGFINSFLSHRHLSLPNRAKAQKLEALLRRLAWIRASIKASPIANNPALMDVNSLNAASTVGAAAADYDPKNGYNDMYDDDSEFDEDEDDEIAAKADLYRASTARDAHDGGIGERFLHSDESAELNQLLKMYQRDLEDSENAATSSNPNGIFLVGNTGNSGGSNEIDYALIIALLRFIVSSEFGRDQGSILIFLPGWDDISRLHRLLMACDDFSQPSFLLLQLHSGVPRKEQQLVFQPVSQTGQRKIILSTNIAETSVTIDEVSVVIDSMLVKEKAYDAHTKLSYLKSTFISQASARQRKGRAGRTRAGVCFRLCSVLRARHLKEYQDSELLRMPLEELVLQAKALRLADGDQGALQFLSKALDPPSELAINQAVHLLQSLQCLTKSSNSTEGEKLTALGEVIAQLPMSPRQGKMLLLGCLFGLSTTTVQLAAIISGRDPFLLPASDIQRAKVNKEKASFCGTSMSDQYAVYKALELYMHSAARHGRSEAHRWCSLHELSLPSCQLLVDSAQQLDKSVRELALPTFSSFSATMGIPTNHQRCVRNVGSIPLTTLTLAMGLYPDFAVRVSANDAQTLSSSLFITEKGAKAKIHPASVNSKISKLQAANVSDGAMQIDIFCFQDLVALNAFSKNYRIGGPEYLMLHTTPVSVLGLCVLCGSLTEEETTADGKNDCVVLVIDEWLKLLVPRVDAQLVHAVRLLVQQSLMLLIRRPESLLLINNNSATKNNYGAIITRALDTALIAIEESQRQILKPSVSNNRK